MLLFLLRRPMCFILHLVCLFMKMHLPALLQGNCLDLVRCAFLRKLSGCILSTPEAEVDKIGRFGRFYTDIPIPIYLYIDDISIYRYRYIYRWNIGPMYLSLIGSGLLVLFYAVSQAAVNAALMAALTAPRLELSFALICFRAQGWTKPQVSFFIFTVWRDRDSNPAYQHLWLMLKTTQPFLSSS